MKQIKVISVLQPWASLIVLGHKQIETRRWVTKFRGEIYIHASKKYTKEQERLAHEFYMLTGDSFVYHNLKGCIIGKANLSECVEFTGEDKGWAKAFGLGNDWPLTDKERTFGDYTKGRYGWLLEKPEVLEEPIPAKGNLSIWNFEIPENI